MQSSQQPCLTLRKMRNKAYAKGLATTDLDRRLEDINCSLRDLLHVTPSSCFSETCIQRSQRVNRRQRSRRSKQDSTTIAAF
ncbi:gp13 [Mycobacterium phage PLot]|uniref:Uncharacterized protein n=1 Tax=Mycobacterium phage PLot TaxID=373411 RepID=Q19YD6_9CAUD|nr:gp13 [Mycobacterium phage PLot]ABD58612.1 hypothetical protein PBI_PLOT_13 [Mycobacterium phage PLot]